VQINLKTLKHGGLWANIVLEKNPRRDRASKRLGGGVSRLVRSVFLKKRVGRKVGQSQSSSKWENLGFFFEKSKREHQQLLGGNGSGE